MRIAHLNLLRYGKFSERALSLPAAERDFHLVLGPNEAGKSTLRAAMADLLYGFGRSTPYAFLHPMPELRLGAVLEQGGQQLAFHRTKGNKNTLRDPTSDAPLPDAALAPFLGGTDRAFFTQMFGLDHSRLVEGGHSLLQASGDLGRILFQSAAGMASLAPLRKALADEAESLWAPRKAGQRAYYQAADELAEAQTALKAASLAPRDWAEQQARLAEQQARLAELSAALEQARRDHEAVRTQRSRLERIRRTAPHLAALQALAEQAAQDRAAHAGQPAPELPASAAATLAEVERELAAAQAQAEQARQQLTQAQAELARLAPQQQADAALLAQAAALSELNASRLQLRAHPRDLGLREAEAQALWRQIVALAAELPNALAAEAFHDTSHNASQDASHAAEPTLRARLPGAPTRSALARLIREQAAVQQALAQSQAELARLGAECSRLEAEAARLPGGAVPPRLNAALAQALPWADAASQRRRLAQALAAAQTRQEREHAALQPPPASALALQAITPPEPAALAALHQRRVELFSQHQQLRAQARELAERCEQDALALAQFQDRHRPVTEHDVAQARQTRDALWNALRAAGRSLAAQPEEAWRFEQALHEADRLADARQTTAQQASEAQARQQQLAQRRLEATQAQGRADAAEQALADGEQHWRELARRCGLPPALDLAAAGPWLAARERSLAARQSLAEAESALEVHDQSCADIAQELSAALAEAGGDAPAAPPVRVGNVVAPPPVALTTAPSTELAAASLSAQSSAQPVTLPALIAQAQARVRQWDEAAGRRHSLLAQQAEALAARAERQHNLASAQAHEQRWQADWAQALAPTGWPADASPGWVEGALETSQRISELLAQLDTLRSQRIATMRADLERQSNAARAWAERLAPELVAGDADTIAQTLATRLAQAQERQAEARRLTQSAQQASQAAEAAASRQQQALARLAPLCALAGLPPPTTSTTTTTAPDSANDGQARLLAALAAALLRSQTQARRLAAQAAAEQALREGGDGLSPEALGAEAAQAAKGASADPAALNEELARLIAQESAQVQALTALAAQRQAAQGALERHTGSDAAAQADAQRQQALARMASAVGRYLKVQTAVRLLDWSIERYRERHQGPMLARAGRHFAALTGGSFHSLSVDFEHEPLRLQARRPAGRLVDIEGLSEGSRDQLYLALRLAALELHLDPAHGAHPLPFIADDLFINYDDRRAAAGLQALANLSRHTQVLFLTHHAHLLPLVHEVLGKGVNVVDWGGG